MVFDFVVVGEFSIRMPAPIMNSNRLVGRRIARGPAFTGLKGSCVCRFAVIVHKYHRLDTVLFVFPLCLFSHTMVCHLIALVGMVDFNFIC